MVTLLFLLLQKLGNFDEPEIFTGSQRISFVTIASAKTTTVRQEYITGKISCHVETEVYHWENIQRG
jgi:hypothetical protein